MIKAARTPDPDSAHSRFDPVFRLGFEWLFLRTEALGKKQTELLMHQFGWQQDQATSLQAKIEADEVSFVDGLKALRGPAADVSDA